MILYIYQHIVLVCSSCIASCIYTFLDSILHAFCTCIQLKFSEENLIAKLTFKSNAILELKFPCHYLLARWEGGGGGGYFGQFFPGYVPLAVLNGVNR